MPLPPDVRRRKIRPPGSTVEIAVIDWGGVGPLALLHHANGFCGAMWGPVARELTRNYHVYSLDARGHGDSDRPQGDDAYHWRHFGADAAGVAGVLAEEHGAERFGLGLGHSFGGTSLLTASTIAPGLFERLVAVDPVIPPALELLEGLRPPSRGGDLAAMARRRRVVWPDRETARRSWQGKNLFANWTAEAFDLYLYEAMADRPDGQVELKCSGEVEAAIFGGSLDFDAWRVALEVKVPVLIQWAERGDFALAYFEELAFRMADARVQRVSAGHLVPMERPDLVIEAVESFAVQASTG